MSQIVHLPRGLRYIAGVATLLLVGCFPMLHDAGGLPDAALKFGSGVKPVDPAIYSAKSSQFPIYRVASIRRPPTSALLVGGILREFHLPDDVIFPDDTWEVRYKFNDFLMVNSLEFDRRQCQRVKRPSNLPSMADGRCGYDWCIYISTRGYVTGGWDNCPMPEAKGYIFMPDPDVVRLQDWGPQPFFEVVDHPQVR